MVDKTEWIGVDFDGTLATYDVWVPWNEFGKPIMPMVKRVRDWLKKGVTVKIVTARVSFTGGVSVCMVTGVEFTNEMMISAMQDWTDAHCGARLPVQCHKDYRMLELWDDRAVQVIPNTGRTLAEEHEAITVALKGKAYDGQKR